MFVKICGITNIDDALFAAECDANAIGFNFYKESKRYISPDDALEIIRELPETMRKVGVFVNADIDMVKKTATRLLLDFVQFHGDEPLEYVQQFGAQAIKVFRVTPVFDPSVIRTYNTPLSLIEAYDPELYGGTGRTVDWAVARAANEYGKIILAGGLTPENIEQAIWEADPFGVDVAGGVEQSPGKKDHAKMKEFIEKARRPRTEPQSGAAR
ncbi:MAG TPA: phosphoribosylanthranilate isomerase [Bacteroidota bacterium]|nr:phosphoribosylanthranilate isomerase [Bacteroidota bacterium]